MLSTSSRKMQRLGEKLWKSGMCVMNYYVSVWGFFFGWWGGVGGGVPCQNIQASGCHGLTSSTTTTREKMGQRFTTSAAADTQAPYAEHFPPIRSRRRTRRSPLDAFALWLDRWRERAVKHTHRGTTTSGRRGSEHPQHAR